MKTIWESDGTDGPVLICSPGNGSTDPKAVLRDLIRVTSNRDDEGVRRINRYAHNHGIGTLALRELIAEVAAERDAEPRAAWLRRIPA